MKRFAITIGLSACVLGLAGCTSALYRAQSAPTDDLYAVHDRTLIAEREKAEAEARKAEAEARMAEWEARMAEARAAEAEQRYYDAEGAVRASYAGTYDDLVADSYQSAYARRLQGFKSMTYRLPSSYFDLRYNSSTMHYLSAYDPAFYNVIVMGDEVWVEPKYITSMFGAWGASSAFYGGGWYFGFNYGPSYAWWGYPHYTWWDWNMAYWYGSPYYSWWYGPGWGWGPHNPYYPWYPGWCGPHHHVHHSRPNYRMAGGGTGSAPRYRPGLTETGGRYRAGAVSGYGGRVTTGPSRGSGTGTGNRVYYESGGRRNGNAVYNGSGTQQRRNTYTPQQNNRQPSRGNTPYTPPARNDNNSSFSNPSRNSGSSFGTPSSGGFRGGSSGSMGGGSRGGSSGGGSRGYVGR